MNLCYHLCYTSHDELLCRSRDDYERMISRIGYYSYRFDSRILAYCVMSNHVHLILMTDSLSKFVQYLRGSYTKSFNAKYCRNGRLGEKGYFSLELSGVRHLLAAISYVLRNPVHHRVAVNPFNYPFSSVCLYYKPRAVFSDMSCNSLKKFSKADGRNSSKDLLQGDSKGVRREVQKGNKADFVNGVRQDTRRNNEQDPGNTNRRKVLVDEEQNRIMRDVKRRRMVNRRYNFPENVVFKENGAMDPLSFVDTGFVEYYFGSYSTFNYHLMRNDYVRWEEEQMREEKNSDVVSLKNIEPFLSLEYINLFQNMAKRRYEENVLTDIEICQMIDEGYVKKFGKRSYVSLQRNECFFVIDDICRRYKTSKEQVARCLGIRV